MIRIDHLKKSYGDYKMKLSMEIKEGTITGLVGKNGAGKSTTIKAILGLIKKEGGSVKVFGKEAEDLVPEDRERMGVALSDSDFSYYLNIEDIIKILRASFHDFDEDTFRKGCEKYNLPMKKILKDFSTGMKARLRVLVALSHKAKLLIMDEPTAGLDVEARNDILDMIRAYMVRDEKCAVLITSHIATDLESLCDDIYMIHRGEIIFHEDTDVILSQYGLLKMDREAYDKIDKDYLLKCKQTAFGYECITKEKQFYRENYPNIVIEDCGIDPLILMLTGGE